MKDIEVIEPGAMLGVVGGGQLGRYLVLSARQNGFRCMVLEPDANAPAMQLADVPLVADYDDPAALEQLAASCAAITIEFENVPAAALQTLQSRVRLLPHAEHVAIAQDRILEKQHAERFGLRPAPWAPIRTAADVEAATTALPGPWILKSARLGYDGKGQRSCADADAVAEAFVELGAVDCVLECRMGLATELSVVLARGLDGKTVPFPVAENRHANGILDTTAVPVSGASQALCESAVQAAKRLADGLDYHGILAVEFFITRDGELLFNEMAPRPHNSGHYTLDACACSQFEQQWRVLCAQPLGDPRLLSPVVMLNLLGERWRGGQLPAVAAVLDEPGACLHLYGKSAARPGRKMGHVNVMAPTLEAAWGSIERVNEAFPAKN